MPQKRLKYKRFLCLVALSAIILFSTITGAYARTLKVGVYNFSPLIEIDKDGGAGGLYIEMLAEVARQEGWTLQYVPGAWSQCFERLKSGEIDILPSIAHSVERAELFDFTSEFLFLDWGIVYAPTGNHIGTVFDLEGLKVSALRGSIYTQKFREMMRQFDISVKIFEMDEYADVFASLENGAVSAAINARLNGAKLENEYDVERTHIYFAPVKLRYAVQKGANGDILSILDGELFEQKNVKDSYYHKRFDELMGGGIGSRRDTRMGEIFSPGGVLCFARAGALFHCPQADRSTKNKRSQKKRSEAAVGA